MKISPLDIRKQTFKRVLRGLDGDEVRMFLEVVASEYEKILQENAMMSEKLHYQEERLAEYRELEKSMRNSLITADRIAGESREASERESDRVIEDARSRGARILEDSRERLQKLVHEIETLRSKKEIYVRRFRTMLEGQMEILQEHGESLNDIDVIEGVAHRIAGTAGDVANDFRVQTDGDVISFVTEERKTEEETRPAVLSTDAPVERPAEEEPAEEEPAESPALQGVGTFFKRSDATVSLEEDESVDSSPTDSDPDEDENKFFQVEERREGFFEYTAKDQDSGNS